MKSNQKPFAQTNFWNRLMHGIYGPRQGGARIIIDAENAATGAAKTSLAVALSRLLANTFDYELQKEDFTLSGAQYLSRWKEHPGEYQPSVIVLDELSGGGAGDSRSAMTNQNKALGSAWQLMRKKRIVTITTLPHWQDADSKMRRFADYRLWCLEDPVGWFVPYKIGAGFDDGDNRTYSMGDGRIQFPNMHAHKDPFYKHVTSLKDDLLDSRYLSADKVVGEDEQYNEELEKAKKEGKKDKRNEIAQQMRDSGLGPTEIGRIIDMSQSWVSRNTEKPD